jgi:hypothetical protein
MKAFLGFPQNWCFGILILCAAGLLFDLPHIVGIRTEAKPAGKTAQSPSALHGRTQVGKASSTNLLSAMMPEQRQYLQEAYGNAVKEIQSRLEQESLLFGFKFALVGSILALLYRTPEKKEDSNRLLVTARSACFVWAAVITCGIIDTRIHFHHNIIGMLGTWIRQQVEPVMLGETVVGWEWFWGHESSLLRSRIYPLLRLNTSLLTFVLFVAAAYVSLPNAASHEQDDETRRSVRKYCRAGCLASFSVFFLVSVHFHPDKPAMLVAYGVLLLAGGMVSWVSWSPNSPGSGRGPCGGIPPSGDPGLPSSLTPKEQAGGSNMLSLAVLFLCFLAAGCVSANRESRDLQSPTNSQPEPSSGLHNKAAAYLATVMDQYHQKFWVYSDGDAAGNHFVTLARMSNRDDDRETEQAGVMLPPMDLFCRHQPLADGCECIEASFRPLAPDDWGAWYFMNGILTGTNSCAEANWGTHRNAGCNLVGTSRLSFWARGKDGGECVEFFTLGVGRDPDLGVPIRLHPDSSSKRSIGFTNLTREWKHYEISLDGAKLNYVLGGFGWAANYVRNSGKSITFYVDDIAFELPRLSEPHFLVSYETKSTGEIIDRVLKNTSYTYDNALALMAFLAAGARTRAKIIADAFVAVQQNDRFYADGSLRNAYQGGDWMTPPGWQVNGKSRSARLPGFTGTNYDSPCRWEEDEYSVSRDTGNMAWAMLGLLAYHEAVASPGERTPYLRSAEKVGEWIVTNCWDTNGAGGYTGGYSGWEKKETRKTYKATEHNIDLCAAFQRLYLLTGNQTWKQRADWARGFVLSMWDNEEGKFWTGTTTDGITINKDIIPLDVQAWALLALREDCRPFIRALEYAENNISQKEGYDFSKKHLHALPASPKELERSGIWYEGTAQMALTYRLVGEFVHESNPRWQERADKLLDFLERTAADGGLPASDDEQLWTGLFLADNSPWLYYRRKHIGATAWLVLAEYGFNPFWPRVRRATPVDSYSTPLPE